MSEITLITDLRQRHVEAFFAALRESGAQDKSGPEYMGGVVRAALSAGIATGATADDVAEMKPQDVTTLGRKVNDLLREAMIIEGE